MLVQIAIALVTAAGIILIWCQLTVNNRQLGLALEQTADSVAVEAFKATLRQEHTQAFSRIFALAESLAPQSSLQPQTISDDCVKLLQQIYVVTNDKNINSLVHRLVHDINLVFQTYRLIGVVCEGNDERLRLAGRIVGQELDQLDKLIDRVVPCLPNLRQELITVRPQWQKVLAATPQPVKNR